MDCSSACLLLVWALTFSFGPWTIGAPLPPGTRTVRVRVTNYQLVPGKATDCNSSSGHRHAISAADVFEALKVSRLHAGRPRDDRGRQTTTDPDNRRPADSNCQAPPLGGCAGLGGRLNRQAMTALSASRPWELPGITLGLSAPARSFLSSRLQLPYAPKVMLGTNLDRECLRKARPWSSTPPEADWHLGWFS